MLTRNGKVLMREDDLQHAIRDLAHSLWRSGGRHGSWALEDWLIAEQMVSEFRSKSREVNP